MLTDPMIRVPTSAKLYSVNEGHTHSFDPSLVNFIEKIKIIKVSGGIVVRPHSLSKAYMPLFVS